MTEIRRKPDSEEIRSVLVDLQNQPWLQRDERSWWPRYLFHYTDIRNAASILQDGSLSSRSVAVAAGKLIVSSGSGRELAGTPNAVKECVRLYFRPKTPTQYWAEGVRSQTTLAKSRYDAHCPVPVFLLFDAADILTRDECRFSAGGLNDPREARMATAHDLRQLPWKRIYHTGSFNPISESSITHHKNAEVTIPYSIDLNGLRYIFCRSEAEKETLLHQLPDTVRRLYLDKIASTSRAALYYREHTFVDAARLSTDRILIRFSPETKSPGPFMAEITLTADGRTRVLKRDGFMANGVVQVPLPRALERYSVTIELDRHLVYAGHHEPIEIPF